MTDVVAIFVQPHFDDVAWSCGGTCARAAAAGRVLLATVCSDGPATGAPLSALAVRLHALWGTGERAVNVRRGEDGEAAALLGAEPLWLGLRDALYRGDAYDTPEKLLGEVAPHERPLVDELAARFRALAAEHPRAVWVCPLGVGGNVDHRIAFDAARALDAPTLFYEDMPYVVRDGAAIERRLAEIDLALGLALAPVLVDVTGAFARRCAAALAYRSQLGLLFRGADPVEVLTRHAAGLAGTAGGRCERLWRRVDRSWEAPAWCSGGARS